MPVTIKALDFDDKAMRAGLKRYTAHVNKQLPRAINKAVGLERSNIRKTSRKDLGIRSKPVNDKVQAVRATARNFNAAVVISTSPIGLANFSKFREKKGGSIYQSRGRSIRRKRAFFGGSKRNRYGRVQIFERTTDKARPIQVAYGPSIYSYVKNHMRIPVVKKRMGVKTLKEFVRLSKANIS